MEPATQLDQSTSRPRYTCKRRQTNRDRVLGYFCEAAQARAPCPTNQDIADRLGFTSLGAVCNLIKALRERGAIDIKRISSNARVVRVVALGIETDQTC